MTRRRGARLGFRGRVLLASTLCAVVAVPPAILLSVRSLAGEMTKRQLEAGVHVSASDLATCREDAEGWRQSLGDLATVRAADATEVLGRRSPSVLSDALLEQLEEGELVGVDQGRSRAGGGIAYRRVADAGPCSLLIYRWDAPTGMPARVLGTSVLAAVLAVALAFALAVLVAIRPLTRRLSRVRASAARVGRQEYPPVGDDSDDAIGEIGTALDAAHQRMSEDAEALAARSRELEEHLANVAHDLKTPIASLQLGLGRALEQNESAPVGELLTGALADLVYVGGLLQNLRLASQLEHGEDAMAGELGVDLAEVVEHVAVRFSLLGETRGVELISARPDDPVRARCEPSMAEQAISNLVHNAVHYGDEGGHVAIVLEHRGGEFVLSVVDDGPGVPPKELPRLTERTFRADAARQRDPKGDGFGLAITNEVCQRAGWSLELVAEEPRGLRATIRGPVVED